MKAQASLEMVVGLIILLVVAGVVISLVLHYVNPKNMPSQENAMKLRDFESKCEEYCKNYDSVEYCRYYSFVDWDKNVGDTELIRLGDYQWPTCEKRIFCFLAFPCKSRFGDGGLATLEKCKKSLCQLYKNKFGDDTDLINQALWDDVNLEGCTYIDLKDGEDWYANVFENGCNK